MVLRGNRDKKEPMRSLRQTLLDSTQRGQKPVLSREKQEIRFANPERDEVRPRGKNKRTSGIG